MIKHGWITPAVFAERARTIATTGVADPEKAVRAALHLMRATLFTLGYAEGLERLRLLPPLNGSAATGEQNEDF